MYYKVKVLNLFEAIFEHPDGTTHSGSSIHPLESSSPSSQLSCFASPSSSRRRLSQVTFDLGKNQCVEYQYTDVPTSPGRRIIGYISTTGDAPGEGASYTRSTKYRSARGRLSTQKSLYPSYPTQQPPRMRSQLMTNYSSHLFPTRFAAHMQTQNGQESLRKANVRSAYPARDPRYVTGSMFITEPSCLNTNLARRNSLSPSICGETEQGGGNCSLCSPPLRRSFKHLAQFRDRTMPIDMFHRAN